MSLDKVLPLLNTAVVRVRTPSEAQVAAGDATLEAARDGVATTHLTGIRVSNDLAIVAVPDVDPAAVELRRGALRRLAARRRWSRPTTRASTPCCGFPASASAAPTLAAAPVAPGFVVGAVSVGQTLDIRTEWLEPGEKVDLPAGAAVFAADGRFAGLTAAVDGGTIIIPGADVLASAEELAAKVKPADAAPR